MSLSHSSLSVGKTPLVPIRKLLKPHKISPSLFEIHAKCEFRNPSGSIWDRLVVHEINKEIQNTSSFVTGGISDLCLSLAWAGTTTDVDVSVAVFPGSGLEDCKLHLIQGFGANVILSFQQDPDVRNTPECLEEHFEKFETTSGVLYRRIMPVGSRIVEESQPNNPTKGPYDDLVEELTSTQDTKKWDVIVCSGQDKCLLQSIRKKFPLPEETLIIEVDFVGNSFTESFINGDTNDPEIEIVHISDAECYDMARRLVREEGLMVGPISGGVMAAAMKQISSFNSITPSSPKNILVILPDSFHNTSKDFLSVDWLVQKGYYSASHLESIFWWYEMAIENISPPEILIAIPGTPIKCVCAAMNCSSTERCVVVTSSVSGENKRVIGVVTIDMLIRKIEDDGFISIEDVCNKQFGIIDSKASFSELERLLRKYNWVINMHRVPVYAATTSSDQQFQINEDVLGAINMADFIRYKRKVERHHLTEYGLAMSDGIPSDVWLETFNEHLKISN